MATNLIEAELQSPFQQEPIGATGLTGGDLSQVVGDPFEFGQKIGNIQAENAFAQLLDNGKAGMFETANALIAEGSLSEEDLVGLDPNNPAFQSADGQLKWYESITLKLKKNVDEKTRIELGGLEDDELITRGFEEDVDVSGLQKGRRQIKLDASVQEVLDLLADGGEGVPSISEIDPSEKDTTVLQTGIDEIDSMINVITRTGTASDPRIKAQLTAFQKNKADLKSRIKESGIASRSTERLSRSDQLAQEKFVQQTTELRSRRRELTELNDVLVDLGQEAGLDMTSTDDFDLPGAGNFASKFKRFEKGKRAKLVILIENIFAVERHALFGGALTKDERIAFNDLRGAKFLGNEDAMLESLRNIRRGINEQLKAGTKRTAAVLKTLEAGGAQVDDTKPVTPTKPAGDVVKEGKTAGGIVFRIRKK